MASDDSEDYEEEVEEEEEDEEEEEQQGRRKRKGRRGGAAAFIDDAAEEDDEEDEEEEARPKGKKRRGGLQFIDDETAVASDDEEEEPDEEDADFMDDAAEDLGGGQRQAAAPYRRMREPDDELDGMNEDELADYLANRYSHREDGDGDGDLDVEQQANLPSVRDPKLWMIKCKLGHEREAAISMMQKYLDKEHAGEPLGIKSVVALDHLKGYIYVEAEKESHVRTACEGMRMIFQRDVKLVPIKEMTEVIKVNKKQAEVSQNMWVRMRSGVYKGDLGQVVDMDHVKQQAIVKLIPRLDLQYVAQKLAGEADPGRKPVRMPQRILNIQEVKDLRIRVERKRDQFGGYVDIFNGWQFQDGYYLKPCSLRSITTSGVVPTFDELQMFQKPSEDGSHNPTPALPVSALKQRKTFVVGDMVQVTSGDLQNLQGAVERVNLEDNTVIFKPIMRLKKGEKPLDAVQVPATNLRKYWTVGNHVKVLAGQHEGTTGLIVKQEKDTVILLSDATQAEVRVFAHDVVEAAEVASGLTKFGEFDLHDLVQLDQQTVGMIVKVEREACQVLIGTPDKQETRMVRRPQIKRRVFDRNFTAQDSAGAVVSIKDIARVIKGEYQGKQGPVEHMFRGMLFIHCREVLENGGLICVSARSVQALGGKKIHDPRTDGMGIGGRGPFRGPIYPPQSPAAYLRSPSHFLPSPNRMPGGPPQQGVFGGGQRGHRRDDGLTGRTVKIKSGPWKGYKGKVTNATDTSVRVELDSQMKTITVRRDQLADGDAPRPMPEHAEGSRTPMHYPKTPMHPSIGSQTPGRDPLATPMRDAMRTPGRDHAWNPVTPHRADSGWADDGGGPGWAPATDYSAPAPAYTPYTPAESAAPTPQDTAGARSYEAPSPANGGWGATRDGSGGYASSAPSPNLPSTPGQPYTPGSAPTPGASYNPATPGTPGGLPGTPGDYAGDPSSPALSADLGGMDGEGKWPLPDILVSVGQTNAGVVREVLPDGSCKVQLGQTGDGEVITAALSELDLVPLKKNDRIKIVKGDLRGATGKLIGIDGADGIVKMDENLDIKILDMSNLGKYVA